MSGPKSGQQRAKPLRASGKQKKYAKSQKDIGQSFPTTSGASPRKKAKPITPQSAPGPSPTEAAT